MVRTLHGQHIIATACCVTSRHYHHHDSMTKGFGLICRSMHRQHKNRNLGVHTFVCVFSHSLICFCIHAFTLARSLTHSLTPSLTPSLTHSLTYSLTHSLTHGLLVCSFVQELSAPRVSLCTALSSSLSEVLFEYQRSIMMQLSCYHFVTSQ